ncbi:hypothetical protein HK098_001163 [Nowakowskiella sp. JEL0407]|nr:hypothetical protein HK098_001163 [Nowakowskiella sp. JEL0407]
MNSLAFAPYTLTYRVLQNWSEYSFSSGLPTLSVKVNDELIIVGKRAGTAWGYFYNIRTQSFGFVPILPNLLFLQKEEPYIPNAFLGVQPFPHFPPQNIFESSFDLPLPVSNIALESFDIFPVETGAFSVGGIKKRSSSSDSGHSTPERRESSSDRDSNSSRSSSARSNPSSRTAEKPSVTFWKGQQKYCKGGALTFPEEVFNMMCPLYNYVMIKNPDNLLFTSYFEELANERLDLYTEKRDVMVWKVWNNRKVDVVTPYSEFKAHLPSRYTNPLILEMFLIFNEWEEAGKELDLLIRVRKDNLE